MNQPLLSVNNLTHLYAPGKGFSDVSFDLWPVTPHPAPSLSPFLLETLRLYL